MTKYSAMPSSTTVPGARPGPRGSLRRAIPGAWTRAFETLLVWQERAVERRRLFDLDQRMLRDIGLTRAEAEREAAKPFWRP